VKIYLDSVIRSYQQLALDYRTFVATTLSDLTKEARNSKYIGHAGDETNHVILIGVNVTFT